MHHIALDRAGTDDGNLDHQIVEIARFEARQHGHLGAALDLKNADRVSLADHVINSGILGGDVGDGQGAVIVLLDEGERARDAGQHAQAEHIDLHQAERVDILLIPFQRRAFGHGGIVDWNNFVEPALGHHETTRVLGEMARKAHQLAGIFKRLGNARLVRVDAELIADPVLGQIIGGPAPDRLGQGRDDIARQAKHLADLADGAARAIAIDRRGHGGAAASVFFVDILDHLLAPLMLEINIDIRRFAAFGRDEAFK